LEKGKNMTGIMQRVVSKVFSQKATKSIAWMEGHASSMFSMSMSKETKGLVGSRYLGTSPQFLLPNCSGYTLHLQQQQCKWKGARMCGSCVHAGGGLADLTSFQSHF
jgi:hypothetical protein